MVKDIVDYIKKEKQITKEQLKIILELTEKSDIEYLMKEASQTAKSSFGNNIYIRGLIEFTNYCRNDCYYCGIRNSNSNAKRYRLTDEQILNCCDIGYELGFRTFVLQGGEDTFFTDYKVCSLVSSIKNKYPDRAVTLSIGEKTKESYKAYFNAGADRYLLRHETANKKHYRMLHPEYMSLENRKRCLYDLKEIGYQTGCGFMVGSPGQTIDTIYEDLLFILSLKPEMVGIGPFIPHKDTPFKNEKAGTLDMTLKLLAIIRLLCPKVLLPATTALGTIDPIGRELGILAGANVVMPNLSPSDVRNKYSLYDNKINTGCEAAENIKDLNKRFEKIGYKILISRGDYSK